MMENMCLQEGDLVVLRSKSLAKGTFVKLQPHTKDFLDISNPKAMYKLTPYLLAFYRNLIIMLVNIFFLHFDHLQVRNFIEELLMFDNW